MSGWDNRYKWDFPLAPRMDEVGFNDTGIGIFKNMPYQNLAKEIIQNVLDARGKNAGQNDPLEVKFAFMEIDIHDIPGAIQLADAIDKCCKFSDSGDDYDQLVQVKEYSDRYLRDETGKIPVLKISDYNTTGLDGVDNPGRKGTAWYGLLESSGSTNKPDGANGSQGIGKYATFNLTRIRTVLYSTKTEDGKAGFQGKAILSTFCDDNGKKRFNKGNFGSVTEDAVQPVVIGIPEVYKRDVPGTDIYIVGFDNDDNWIDELGISVVEYFFYAIYKGTLKVVLENGNRKVQIDSDNIDNKIEEYDAYYQDNHKDDRNFKYTAPLYWKVITDNSPNHYHIVKEFLYDNKSMGEYELHLLMDPELNTHKVLETRKSGMKISEDTGFRLQQSFAGVFIATGNNAASDNAEDNISSFLRKCEDAKHDTWSSANFSKVKDRKKAGAIIRKIHSIIREEIQSRIPKDNTQIIKAIDLPEMLLSQGSGDSKDEYEDAFRQAIPMPTELQTIADKTDAIKDRNRNANSNGRGKHTSGIPKDEPLTHDNHRNNKKGKRKLVRIMLPYTKTFYDEENGQYVVVLCSDLDVDGLYLAINVVGDDGQAEAADIISACMNDAAMDIKQDYVILPRVIAGQKCRIEIRLRGNERERLEVNAYGKL